MPKGRLSLPILVVGCFVVAVNLAAASNWPRFRGPNGTGCSEDRTIPVVWASEHILWKAELPGPGNSSPVVWNGRVFVQAATKDGSERMLLCLDAKTGSTHWIEKTPGKAVKIHKWNTLASASPGVDADHVYAVFWDGTKQILNAYTHAGKQVWSHDFGKFSSEHGAGASPIPIGDKVYFNNDQDTSAELFCLDGKTGKVVWSAKRPHLRACYSSPLLRTFSDGRKPELVVVTTMGISGYDPDTGAQYWDWKWDFKAKPMRTVGSPIYDHGIVFASSGDNPLGGPRHMVAVRPGDKSPQLVWENLKDFPYMSTLVAHGKHIYSINDGGVAGCYEAETGKRTWFERVAEGGFSSSPIVIDGKIYVASEYGDVYVIAADPVNFQILAKNSLGETVRATPAVADERMFVRGEKHLFCIGKAR
jgi:outer membrane protein assembly factor BamB